MQWQDVIFAIGQVIFIIALIPSILSKNKPSFTTSLLTAFVLLIYAFLDLTLSLYLTAVTMTATGFAWFILAYQKYKIGKKR